MGLFNLFKKQPGDSPAREYYTEAKAQFEEGDFQQALQTLIYGFRKDVNYYPLYELSAASLAQLGGDHEKYLFEEALRNFDSADPFIQLGTHFSSTGHYTLAQPFLEKALQLQPGDVDLAHDLAIAYARRFEVAKAVETLESVAASDDFWAYWFLVKCWLLNQQPDKARRGVASLQQYLRDYPDQEQFDIFELKVEELREAVERYQTIPDPQMHIRDWQFIQYGSVILDYFDKDDDQYVAGGRYVASWGSLQGLKENINALHAFIHHLSLSFDGVRYVNDRHSAIVGMAIAGVLGLPAGVYHSEAPNRNCLIVAGNSSALDQYDELRMVRDGQLIYVLNHSWLENAYTTPDVIGFMSQSYYFPWEVTMKVTEGKVDEMPPDDRSEDEIAQELIGLAPEHKDHSALLAFYSERKDHLKAIGKSSNHHRYNFMIESPVPGAYFGV